MRSNVVNKIRWTDFKWTNCLKLYYRRTVWWHVFKTDKDGRDIKTHFPFSTLEQVHEKRERGEATAADAGRPCRFPATSDLVVTLLSGRLAALTVFPTKAAAVAT